MTLARAWRTGWLAVAGLVLVLSAAFAAGGVLLAPDLPPPDALKVAAPAIDTAPGGGKPTLILLHGAGLNAHMWDAVIRHLDPRWRVIAIDLPGHGSRPRERYSLAAAQRAVAHAAELAAPFPVVLAGDSLGGFTAIGSAAVVPEAQLRGLLVAGAAGDMPASRTPMEWGRRLFFRWLIALGDERKLAFRALSNFEVPPQDAKAIVDAGVRLGAVEIAVDELAGQAFGPLLARVSQPVLFVNGALDPGHAGGIAAYLKAAPDASVTYEGVGHGISMRRPERFAGDLNTFAARVFSRNP